MTAYIHPDFVELAEAKLHISDLSIQRGFGIFDFFKVHDGHVFFLNSYLDRFYASAATMRLAIPLDREKIIENIYTLISKNKLAQSGIKLILTGGYSEDGFTPAKPNLLMIQSSLTIPPQDQLLKGIRVITHEYVRDVPGVKTINYTTGIWLLEKMQKENAADVLYHNAEMVSEFPRSNFFIVKHDGTVITPSEHILRGVTRQNVLMLSGRRYPTSEGNVTIDDVYQAKEAFLTSTTKRIVPVIAVNGRIIGDGVAGTITKQLLHDVVALEDSDRFRSNP